MPQAQSPQLVSPGLIRFSGMYGHAMRDGVVMADVVECTGTIDINRIEVPLVGFTRNGHKPGRETRDGTIRFDKIDSRWENEILTYLAGRATGAAKLKPFQMVLEVNDPDALGKETWQLNGCILWRFSVGFSITEDIQQRELPFTWESEQLLFGYHAEPDSSGQPSAVWYPGAAPPAASSAPSA